MDSSAAAKKNNSAQ